MNDPTELVKFAKCYAEAWRSQARRRSRHFVSGYVPISFALTLGPFKLSVFAHPVMIRDRVGAGDESEN